MFTETAGLVASHGEPWYEVRSKVQQDMMRPKSAMYYINDIEEISQQLVDLMTANVDSEGEVEDIVKHIQCWSLESTAFLLLNLANNPAQQEELFQEIQRVVGEGREGNITESKLNQMIYLKACLHESQRLNLGATRYPGE